MKYSNEKQEGDGEARVEPRDDEAGLRNDILEAFQEIVEREWAPAGETPLQRLLPDSRYSCTAPFWI